jgi:hypothetical protein
LRPAGRAAAALPDAVFHNNSHFSSEAGKFSLSQGRDWQFTELPLLYLKISTEFITFAL